MSPDDLDPNSARRLRHAALPARTSLAFAVALIAVLLIAFFSYQSLQQGSSATDRLAQSSRSLDRLKELMITLLNAETGTRGYLLTGEERYLDPYMRARSVLATDLDQLRASASEARDKIETLARLAADSLAHLEQTVMLRREGDEAAAVALVRSGRGKLAMDRVREQIGLLERDEEAVFATRQQAWREAATTSTAIAVTSAGVLLGLILVSLIVAVRGHRAQRSRSWLESGQVSLSIRMGGEQSMEALGASVLQFIGTTSRPRSACCTASRTMAACAASPAMRSPPVPPA
ncbi:MAG: CHASE3 domain-containing protein [Burkholderiaceae bacterium]